MPPTQRRTQRRTQRTDRRPHAADRPGPSAGRAQQRGHPDPGAVSLALSASTQRGGGTYSKVPYSASKAAVLGLTRALAREVGADGVTVNAVSPGPIDTDIMGGTLSDERRADLVRDLVVDRVGTVEDVAAVIDFLLGEDAGYVTGATYNVNGGLIVD